MSLPNGGAPVAAYVMVEAQANTSAGGPIRSPRKCSGPIYDGVPAAKPVVAEASISRAMPKSMTRGPSGPTSTLLGLKSRCTTPAPWTAAKAVMVPSRLHPGGL